MILNSEQFNELYTGTELINYQHIFNSEPKSDKEFIEKYLSSKLWRLNNLYRIINIKAQSVPFVMNYAQHRVYSASLTHPRLIVLKSRQQGISTFWLISFFDDCLFLDNLNSGLMSQNVDASEILMLKIKFLWDNLAQEIKDFLGVRVIKNNTKEISFSNNSSMFIRTSFRSTTLQRLHISEFGKIANANPDKAKETRTGTLQSIASDNIAIIESTAEGDNIYKHMWDNAMAYAGDLSEKDFKPVFLSWVNDPNCLLKKKQEVDATAQEYFNSTEHALKVKLTEGQKNFWVAKHREIGDFIYQEFPATPEEAFLTSREGAYYAQYYMQLIREKGREVKNLFDSNLPVQVAFDLGRNGLFVMVFFQTFTDGFRIIDCYYNSDLEIQYYCKVMDSMQKTLGYDIELLILPHDAEVKDMSRTVTREEIFWDCGYKNTFVVERTKDINLDIDMVRQAMNNMYVDVKAQYVIDCFLNYSRKKDEKRDLFLDKPENSKFCHGADAVRQMVIGGEKYITKNEIKQRKYRQNFGIDI